LWPGASSRASTLLRHRRVAQQDALDLARLDAEAADLHLVVGAADELDTAVVAPAHAVSAAVHALAGAAGRRIRIGDEALGGERGAPDIAARQSGAGDIQLAGHAGHAGRHRAQAAVQHVDAHIVQRLADRHRGNVRGQRRHGVGEGESGGLGRPVAVDDAQAGIARLQAPDRVGREHVAAGPDLAQAGEQFRRGLGELVEQPCRQPHAAHAVRGGQALHVAAVDGVRGADHHAAAAQQRHPQFIGGGIEGVRRMQHHHIVAVIETAIVGEGDDVALAHRHALGRAGRAGGEHDVGELLRMRGRSRRRGRRRLVIEAVDPQNLRMLQRALFQAGVGEQQ
jgi:hypothetical protein